MKFVLKANAIFEADNIDDAFRALALHFSRLRSEDEYEDSQFFEPDSDIEIKKL